VSRHWAYGQILPRAYWAPQYHLADYWLFGLEVPPPGCEWVRDDDDALLVDVTTGEIMQVEYGVFA
jgi:Ni/Co efflux regulator RcnB